MKIVIVIACVFAAALGQLKADDDCMDQNAKRFINAWASKSSYETCLYASDGTAEYYFPVSAKGACWIVMGSPGELMNRKRNSTRENEGGPTDIEEICPIVDVEKSLAGPNQALNKERFDCENGLLGFTGYTPQDEGQVHEGSAGTLNIQGTYLFTQVGTCYSYSTSTSYYNNNGGGGYYYPRVCKSYGKRDAETGEVTDVIEMEGTEDEIRREDELGTVALICLSWGPSTSYSYKYLRGTAATLYLRGTTQNRASDLPYAEIAEQIDNSKAQASNKNGKIVYYRQ
jgi:hypothetical protein